MEVARFVMRYEDGTEETRRVRYFDDVADWMQHDGDTLADERVGWLGESSVSWSKGLGLSELIWKNPHPEKVIETIDFVSAEAAAAPFLVAITLE